MSFSTNFLDDELATKLVEQYGSPLYVYSKDVLAEQAGQISSLPVPYGLEIRYAMKANPHIGILEAFREKGLSIDASSSHEAYRALEIGFLPEDILLTSQQLPAELEKIVEQGVEFNATSLHQLEQYGKIAPGTEVSVRINPGIGSGHSAKTNVGGLTSSFGIWHEYIPKVHELADLYNLRVIRLHTQIGSGTDPAVWQEAAKVSLDLVNQFPDVVILNLGGGFKVARMDEENGVDVGQVGIKLKEILSKFALETGRELQLELEPGTYLVANAGILIAKIEDIVDTGSKGYRFIKLNTGMNDILRPTLYGSQHPMKVISSSTKEAKYVVVGHNCESADLLSPSYGNHEQIAERSLREASIGDLFLIGGAGAYCASMAAHGYNSFPSAKEVII